MALPVDELTSGEVRCVFTHDPQGVCALIEQAVANESVGARLLSVQPSFRVGSEKLTAQLTRSLAEAVRLLWPDWYDGSMHLDFDVDPAVRPAIDRLATRQMLRRRRGVNAEWLFTAWHACRSRRSPFVPTMSLAVQTEQLSLALSDDDLFIAAVLAESVVRDSDLLVFSRSMEWLATETDAKVVVVIPESLRDRHELDGITSSALQIETTRCDPSIYVEDGHLLHDSGCREEHKHLVCPIIGRPHPASPGEQKLAVRLAVDPELSGLFRFNERVTTVFDSRYLVDLVWPSGRMAIEIDGYGYHSTPAAFNADRHRDYELTLSGYLVLRLPHDSVIDDVDLAVERIREFVSFRQRHPFMVVLTK